MSTIHGTAGLGPATAKRQVYSPLETYWNAFQEWRKRERLRTQLCLLTDSELVDIGITHLGYLRHGSFGRATVRWPSRLRRGVACALGAACPLVL
jgi:uncharacterized protein YjiS (DUF1127 family)